MEPYFSSDRFVDFATVFEDRSQVCDFSPCIEEISIFFSTVGSLIGRDIEPEEISAFERMLRKQYRAHGPFRVNREVDDYIYETPWTTDAGTALFAHVILRRLGSIKVENADKKMVKIETCTASGEPIGALRSLPWTISNIREIRYAFRNLYRGWFPHDLIGARLFSAWQEAGGSADLPMTVFITELPDGGDFSLRFVADGESEDAGRPRVRASVLVDDAEVALRNLLPRMLRKIDLTALGEDSMESFFDMKGVAPNETYRQWLNKRVQRYDYLESFADRFAASGIVRTILADGEQVEIFHSGDFTADGRAIYGLCREKCDGLWRSVLWVLGEHLVSVGVRYLPTAPDWKLMWFDFDPTVPRGSLSRHVLQKASRWADPETLTGKKEAGCDIFVDEEARERMYAKACAELETSLAFCSENPECVTYGYYHPTVDHARGDVSPIAIYLPAFFSEKAKATGVADAVFAVRVVTNGGRVHYEFPTVLPVSYARQTAAVIGRVDNGQSDGMSIAA